MPAATRKITLTDRLLQSTKAAPDGARSTIWDVAVPGLAVRVGSTGKRSFYVVKRQAGEHAPRWIALGAYPDLPLKDAREKARAALRTLAEGKNPAALAKAAEAKRRESTFAAVADQFIARHVANLRTGRAVEALIRRELVPALGDKPIAEIRHGDVSTLLLAIIDRGSEAAGRKSGGASAARKTLAAASKLFNWALSAGLGDLETNPCARIKPANLAIGVTARDRVLTDPELRLVWTVASATDKAATGYPFGPLVKALLLTGQRLNEIAAARWSEITDLEGAAPTLTVPASRMKGKVAHVVPLSPRVVELLDTLPRLAGSDYLFTTTGLAPVSGFSKMKARFDAKVTKLNDGHPLPHWTLHDLRRTMRTGLAAAGVPVFIAELAIGHRQTGVHAVYDLHRYDSEKRDALDRWATRLAAIVEPPPANVVALRQSRQEAR